MEKQLRKHQQMLLDAGKGMILFAVWSVVKLNMYLGLSATFLESLQQEALNYGVDKNVILGLICTIFALVLLGYLTLRLYVGLNAMAEGKGREKGEGYLVLDAVLLGMSLVDLRNIYLTKQEMTVNLLVGFCMEIASIYILVELLVRGICVKHLKKKMKE